MKRFYFMVAVIGMTALNAQVGINTTEPQEMLHINGTVRITELPEDGAKNAFWNGGDKTSHTFTASKMLVTDKQGNIGTIDSPWRLHSSDVNSRYENINPYSTSVITAQNLTEIPNSEIRLSVPKNGNKKHTEINWTTSFSRTDAQGNVQEGSPGTDNCDFTITLKIYDAGNNLVKELTILQEYFYQDAVPGYFSKTLPIQYTDDSLPAGDYVFKLYVGKSPYKNGFQNDNNFYLMNTRITGNGKVYIQ